MKSIMIGNKKLSGMTLGTVQLGMNYGIANSNGKPDVKHGCEILKTALESGITSLDTARAYGTSEEVLGTFLKNVPGNERPFITSKLIVGLPETASEKEVETVMTESVEASLATLGVNKLDCLMLHRGAEMTKHRNAVPKTLDRLIKKGYISTAGVSVYGAEELDTMLENDIYTATQLPMSLFDQKLIHKGYLDKLYNNKITVFVRSVFLQGLFFLEPDKITDPQLKEYALPHILKLRQFCDKAGMSIAEFAISFIRDVKGVSSLVLGAETKEQVIENVKYMNAPALSESMRSDVKEAFKDVDMKKIMEVLSRSKQ